MIWFSCQQCGKLHGRPENSVGTLVFCTCGHGNTVPWESTEPEPAVPPPGSVPSTPDLMPVAFPVIESSTNPPDLPPKPRRRGRAFQPKIDPNFCLNHDVKPTKANCKDCGESFCENCLVTLEGDPLCGPCKNYRVRQVTKPIRLCSRALLCAMLAILTGPMALCWIPLLRPTTAIVFLVPLIPHGICLWIGWRALKETSQAGTSGRALAFSGLLTASVAGILTLVLFFYSPRLGGS